ncbi:MAG: recombinase family protein [Acutalibacteraceae bacterium]
MYSKDLSLKIRSAVKTRNRRGLYWGGQAFYGYRLDPSDKHKLLVDEDVRTTIERIFEWCIEGLSTMEIAKRLNARKIPSPAEHKRQNGERYNGRVLESESLWLSERFERF